MLTHLGLRHLALSVVNLEACEIFYTTIWNFRVEWKPDADNVYLTSGSDNLALHRAVDKPQGPQRLDHLGFVVKTPEEVDAWYAHCQAHQVIFRSFPKTHRDGARSFYCEDPAGNIIQLIHIPSIQ